MASRLFPFLGIVVLVLCLASCRDHRTAATSHPNVLLILIDTLRKDHVGTYGYGRETTPTIDALAENGLVFENAVAQAPWTLPSVMSLFTSRYPPVTEQSATGLRGLASSAITLAEVLKKNGYRTISVATNPYNADVFHLMQGFDVSSWHVSAPASWVVDRAIDALHVTADERRPIFLYLQFMDTHDPRRPPAPYDTYFSTVDGKPHDDSHERFERFLTGDDLQSDAFVAYRSHTVALYDGALRFVDAEVDRLLAYLAGRAELEDAPAGSVEAPPGWLVVVLSDHGEEFWEHARLEKSLGLASAQDPNVYGVGHGHALFAEQIDVPLILAGADVRPGRVAHTVRLIDILPTILALAGVRTSETDFAGVDLTHTIATGTDPELVALSETWVRGVAHASVRADDGQRIRAGEREFTSDGDEEGLDGARIAPSQARLHAELERLVVAPPRAPSQPTAVGRALQDRLRALGYAE